MGLTIRQFQQIHQVTETDLTELDKSILIVKIYTGFGDKEIDKMSTMRFNRICYIIKKSLDSYLEGVDKGKPKKFIKVNGTLYRLDYDITRLSSGKYVEASAFNEDMIGNLHKLLATMAVPMRWTWKGLKAKPYDASEHAKIAENMLDADFSVAYHACVFFWAVLMNSIKSLNISGSLPEIPKLAVLEKHLLNTLDGSITANWYRNLKPLS